jgi:hypothetical protein
MAPILRFTMSSESKKKELTCTCLSEAKASHSHKMWTEVSSSVLHFLHVAFLLNPITCRCLIGVLCLVRRPVTTVDGVLLKNSNQAFAARLKSILKPVSEYYTDHATLPYASYPPSDIQSKYNFYFSNRTASCFSCDDSHNPADHKCIQTNCLQLQWLLEFSNLTNVLLFNIHDM